MIEAGSGLLSINRGGYQYLEGPGYSGFVIDPTGNCFVQLGLGSGFAIFGATPVVQQTALGTTAGFTAGVGTPANDDSTYTGGVGASAYTVGDVVLALKNYGWLAM